MTNHAEVIGDPIAQSKSPAIHNYWIARLGLDAEYRACHVKADGLADYLKARNADDNWRGCNVTMPHKQAVIPLLDRLEPTAERVGAVNTIVRNADGTLRGDNTDVAGFLEPLRPILPKEHIARTARIVGTGGAARAIVAGLAGENFRIVLAGRDPAKARALLDELAPGGAHEAISLAESAGSVPSGSDRGSEGFDLVVNASPLGMAGQPPLSLDLGAAPPGCVVYDIVTHPVDTPLLASAREAGLRTIDGLSMLIGQAAVAFETFFGVAPPRDDGDAELRKILTS